jgi:hypothetical protein
MNRYLSKPEKVSLTRIMLLVDVLDQVIADYQKAKGVDYDGENMWESDGEVHETPEEAAD